MNECGACGLDFGSISAFDAHRVGKHEHLLSADHVDGRRCLTAGEIGDAGWKQDTRGRWRLPGDSPWKKGSEAA